MDQLCGWESIFDTLCFLARFVPKNVCETFIMLSIRGLLLLFLEHTLMRGCDWLARNPHVVFVHKQMRVRDRNKLKSSRLYERRRSLERFRLLLAILCAIYFQGWLSNHAIR